MSMDKPSQQYPSTTTRNSIFPSMPPLIPDPSLLGQSFDQLLNQRGVRMIHSKAVPCPNVVAGVEDNIHDPDCNFCDNNGFIYYAQKEIWGYFGSNSIQKTFETHGVWETGSATVTVPTEYPDGTEADFNTFDKLEVPDFTIRLWEMKDYEERPGNIQTLRYPIQKIELATSIANGVQKFYVQGEHFNIDSDGNIEWIPGKAPSNVGRGEAISWAYYAKPVYIVVQTLRELRITQELAANGVKIARRLPQSLLVKRDFLPNKPETIAS